MKKNISKKISSSSKLIIFVIFTFVFVVLGSIITISQQPSKIGVKPTVGKNLPPSIPEQIKQKPPITLIISNLTTEPINFEIKNTDNTDPAYNQSIFVESEFKSPSTDQATLAPNDTRTYSIGNCPKVFYIRNLDELSLKEISIIIENKELTGSGKNLFYYFIK